MVTQDESIRQAILEAAERLGESSIDCEVEDGHVVLEGMVSSDERSYQLDAAAHAVEGVRSVRNNLMVEGFEAIVGDVADNVDLSPDFTADVGAEDAQEAISEAEPYFPPTDPVVEPDRSTDGVEIVGGFAETSEDEAGALSALPSTPRGPDEIRDAVLRALHLDAGTRDLNVDVEVQDGVVFLRGVVPSLDDADLAESVAAGVPGVDEVQDELDVEGL